jgi:hypothetical protein
MGSSTTPGPIYFNRTATRQPKASSIVAATPCERLREGSEERGTGPWSACPDIARY